MRGRNRIPEESLAAARAAVSSRVIRVPFSDCHYFDGVLGPGGYGRFSVHGRRFPAHRLAYEAAHGAIPSGPPDNVVMHTCDERSCVNPDHLVLGTQAENAADMSRKGRARHGAKHYASKYSAEVVLEVKTRLARGENGASIARELGCSAPWVHHVKSGRARRLG